MAKESPCRNGCTMMLHFDPLFKTEQGKWIPLEPDNTPHQCPNSPYNLKNAASTVASAAATQQVQQQQPQQQQQQQAPMATYDVAHALDIIDKRIQRIEEYYGDLVELLKAVTQNQTTKNQQMSDTEARYDRDREDGSLYGEQ